jgi:predicted O-methyltransferase YrrM
VNKSWRREARYAVSLRRLPPRVAWFLWRARRHAVRSGDQFSLASAARPVQLAALLDLARGRDRVVELGTGSGWSAIALALDDTERRVVSYDPVVRPEREAYLAMVSAAVRQRIELRDEADTAGPRPGESADLLFIDSSHDRESVLAAFSAWRSALARGAAVAFHDYRHDQYPGVREAVLELGILGEESEGMFVWRAQGAGA